MKPRSTVMALLAMTESLLAARAAKAARTKAARARPATASRTPSHGSKLARLLGEVRPLFPRIKIQAIS